MQLCQAHFVSLFYYKSISIRHVNARFYNSCAYKQIDFVLHKPPPHVCQLVLAHLPVRYTYIYIGQLGFKHPCAALNAFNAVVQVINLSSAAYFLIYRVGYNA